MQKVLPPNLNIDNSIIEPILGLLINAGQIALKYRDSRLLKIEYKKDQSPVTNADIDVNDLILQGLAKITPHIFVVSEENECNDFKGDLFWLLDPIDGTKYYIEGLSGYTINLALIWKNQPIIGFVYHPSLQEIHYNNFDGKVMLYNTSNGENSLCQSSDTEIIKILVRESQENSTRIYDNSIFSIVYPTQVRSKIAMLLNNEADVYYLYNQVMEWDTAPVHAILKALGGNIIDMDGHELVYGKPFYCNPSVIICNHNALNEKQKILNNI